MKKFLSLLAFALTYMACMAAHAAHAVTVGFDSGSPPFFMETRNGEPVGIYPGIVMAAFKEAGLKVNLEAAPFKRVLANVDRGNWGAGGILKTPARLAKYDYSEYIFIETLAVYYPKKKPIRFTGIADLRGMRIGILHGWSYGQAFDVAAKDLNIRIERTAKDETNFRKLQAGRLDAVLVLDEVGAYLMKSGRFDELERAQMYFSQNPAFIAFRKTPEHRALLEKLNPAIVRIRQAGLIEKVVHAYLQTNIRLSERTARASPGHRSGAQP